MHVVSVMPLEHKVGYCSAHRAKLPQGIAKSREVLSRAPQEANFFSLN